MQPPSSAPFGASLVPVMKKVRVSTALLFSEADPLPASFQHYLYLTPSLS